MSKLINEILKFFLGSSGTKNEVGKQVLALTKKKYF